MRKKTVNHKAAANILVKGIRRQTRKRHSTEENIRIVLAGLRGDAAKFSAIESTTIVAKLSVLFESTQTWY